MRPTTLRTLSLLTLGLAAGWGLSTLLQRPPKPVEAHGHSPTAKKQLFQCPMHPQIVQDHEGSCPICGMTLVPVGGEAAAASAVAGLAEVTIDPARQQLIGLRTVKVAGGPLGGAWRTSGRVVPDETRVRKVSVKVEGFVERLFVDVTGQRVAKGQPLLSLYSPDFVSAQQEYLLALKTKAALQHGELSDSGADLVASARRRLQLWDVPEGDLVRLDQGGEVRKSLTLLSPLAGIVTDKKVVQGQRVGPTEALFEITDLSRVWVMADAYEPDLGRVKVGQAATFAATAFPGRTFQGRIAFIDPVMDPKTRTARLRIELANPKGELKPEMFGDVAVQGPTRKGLSVPQDAVLETGSQAIVFVVLGEGRFQPREVVLGQRADGRVEIKEGLGEGESVVSGATFLVDSESSLRAAMAQLGAAQPAHRH